MAKKEMQIVCIGPANVEIPFKLSALQVVVGAMSLDKLPEGKHDLATYMPSPGADRDEYVLVIQMEEQRVSVRFTASPEIRYNPAGSALNIAVGCARVGARVRLVTSLVNVPHDELSSRIRSYVLRHGIEVIEVNRPMTPVTFIIIDADGEREKSTVLSYKPLYTITRNDANNALTEIKQGRATHVLATGIRMPELALVRKAFRRAGLRGATTCFIPNPSILSPSHRNIRSQLKQVLAFVDVWQMNDREAEVFLGKREGTLSLPRDVMKIAQQTRVPTLIVTRGARGAAAVVRGQYHEVAAHRATPRVVDTTGAGDAFLVGFVFAQHEGCTIEESFSLAAFSATSNIMAIGGHAGMPSRDQLLWRLSQLRETRTDSS